jgi:hypothetical protein
MAFIKNIFIALVVMAAFVADLPAQKALTGAGARVGAKFTSDIVTELKKLEGVTDFNDPKYVNYAYQKLLGFTPTKEFYKDGLYEDQTAANLICKYIVNMHLFAALYPDSKDIDLRFIGAFDPLETNRRLVTELRKNGWTNSYKENRDAIKSCVKSFFHISTYKGVTYDRSIYDPENQKNNYLESMYMAGLSLSYFIPTKIYAYSYIPGNKSVLADKKVPQGLVDVLYELKRPGLIEMSAGGALEAGVQCYNITDASDADTNKTRNMTKITCPIRKTRHECTDSTYLINKSIVQNMGTKKDLVKLLKVYGIQVYSKDTAKIAVKNRTTTFDASTSDWDYHEASLVVFQDVNTKEVYMAVIDNFFNIAPMTLSEWMSIFSAPKDLKFRAYPFVRVQEREDKYMTLEAATQYSKENTRNPD